MGVPGACGGSYWVYCRDPAKGILIAKLSHVRQKQAKDWDARLGIETLLDDSLLERPDRCV